jgi:hypothetical protein
VEHILSNPSGRSGHSWRTIAVVVAGIATLELLGLVAVGVALVAKPVMHRARKEAAATTSASKKPAKVAARRPPRPRACARAGISSARSGTHRGAATDGASSCTAPAGAARRCASDAISGSG